MPPGLSFPPSVWVSLIGALLSLGLAYKLRLAKPGAPSLPAGLLLAFWLLVPPCYFLWEFTHLVQNTPADTEYLKTVQDLSRNVWVAYVIVLVAILNVKWPTA